MTHLLTAAQMRALEQAAIESGEVTGLELMERAGRGVVEAIFEEWPKLRATSHRAVVLCGPGNNGGDGFVVARLLKEWGWEVEVFLYGDPEKLPPDARVNFERWSARTMAKTLAAEALISIDESHPDVIVDALFGTGLTRPLEDELLQDVAHGLNLWGSDPDVRVVAVDMPSGMCADSGKYIATTGENPLRTLALADMTVSFDSLKLGHHLQYGPAACGRVVVVDIGLGSPAHVGRVPPGLGGPAPAQLRTKPDRWSLTKAKLHKYTHGHAVILSGAAGKGGAARLAARGALRIGAGLVTLAGPTSVQYEHNAQINAIMWREIKGAPGLTELLEDNRLNALCLGPGLGLSQGTAHLVLAALKETRATVLDADALTQFQRDPQVLFDALHENTVLTPHAGEFKRLFPDLAAKLNAPATKGPAYSKVDATREAAARAGCTVLFKGPDTVIANQTGAARINSAHYDRSAPWLATAGSGDVLAGFITGLLARGFAPLEAASTAAWLHVECALSFGPGLIAEDLPEALPSVFRKLGL